MRRQGRGGIGVVVIIGWLLLGMAAVPALASTATAELGRIEQGDVVQVHVTGIMEDGSVLFTTRQEVLEGKEWLKHPGFTAPQPLLPEEVVAGRDTRIPGMGSAVLGLAQGDRAKLTLSAAEAFGRPDPQARREFPCEKSVPRELKLSAEQYLQMTGTFPREGQLVDAPGFPPYTKVRVAVVEDAAVTLELSAEDGQTFQEDFGVVDIEVSEDEIRTRLTPRIGAGFPVEGGAGRIVASDGKTFTVDLNPPGLDQSLTLDIEILSRIPGQTLSARKIDWGKEFDKGVEMARGAGKPVVLVLYADWCTWCERFFSESVMDPRVRNVYDDYVWLKINSDVETGFKEKFAQQGFPMIVLLSPTGDILKKTEGFMDGETLFRELRSLSEIL